MTTPPTKDELDELRAELESAFSLLEVVFGQRSEDALDMSIDVSFEAGKLQALNAMTLTNLISKKNQSEASRSLSSYLDESRIDLSYVGMISSKTFSFFFHPDWEEWFEEACLVLCEKNPDVFRHLLDCEDDNFDLKFCLLYSEVEYGRLSIPWIAAASELALDEGRLVEQGYWSSLLQQKIYNENDFARGKRTVRAAATGGQSKAIHDAARAGEIVEAMRPLIERRKLSVSRAGEIVFERGLGSSGEANRKLWARRSR